MEDYEKSLGHWIKRFYLLSAREMDALLAPYNLGRTQWYILHHVHAQPQLPQRELQSILGIESATLTPLIAALSNKGWVQQLPAPSDKRSKLLILTPAGKAHFEAIPNPILQARTKAFSGIGRQDLEHARMTIQQAVRNLEQGE